MTQDDIIRMAREAGFDNPRWIEGYYEIIERFAQAAFTAGATHEREAMVSEAAKKGWAMKNEDPFEDCVQEIANIRARGNK